MSATIPDGFVAIDEAGTFLGHIGGLHWRKGDGLVQACLILERRHTNPIGVAHGGLLMTLLDITLGASAYALLPPGVFPLTLQHSCSFIRGAKEGALLQCEARADATTRSLIYVSGRAYVDDDVIATGTALFRMPPADAGARSRVDEA